MATELASAREMRNDKARMAFSISSGERGRQVAEGVAGLFSTHLPSAEEHTPANCSSRDDKGAGDTSIESGAEQNELSSTLSRIFSRIRWVNYEQLSPLFRGDVAYRPHSRTPGNCSASNRL